MTMLEARNIGVTSGGINSPNGGLFARLGKTSLRKQIGWHVAQAEPHAALMTITPDAARDLLVRNEGEDYHNRPLSGGTVSRYASEMARGWRLTGETIIISRSGKLLNGQHRLQACIASGQSFQTFVVFGIADDAFAFMDKGKKRTAADIFSINGIADQNVVASATLWVWKYYHSGMQNPHGGTGPEPDQLYDFFLQHQGLLDSLTSGRRFVSKALASMSLMTALHYLCAKKNKALADSFFYDVATNDGVKKSSAAGRLHNRLLDERIAGGSLSNIYAAAFTVMSWNSIRRNEKPPLLRWRTEGAPDIPFPAVV